MIISEGRSCTGPLRIRFGCILVFRRIPSSMLRLLAYSILPEAYSSEYTHIPDKRFCSSRLRRLHNCDTLVDYVAVRASSNGAA